MSDRLTCMPRNPLAACLLALALASPPALAATTWTINVCDDSVTGSGTSGSLRYAAANALSGDTIDMSLNCSVVTFASGDVVLPQTDITLQGSGMHTLVLSGNGTSSRVLTHTGTGTLSLKNLSVVNGQVTTSLGVDALGGCIRSNGSVFLDHVAVQVCRATEISNSGEKALGGGIHAANNVYGKYSDISNNTVSSETRDPQSGGAGIYSKNSVALFAQTTISGNSATKTMGGGIRTAGSVTVKNSAISGNSAFIGGAIHARSATGAGVTFSLQNSTVSGNLAEKVVGGVWSNAETIQVYNATVAFNTAASNHYYGRDASPGLNIDDTGAYYTDSTHFKFKNVTLQSSVITNNSVGVPPWPDDLGITRFSNFNAVRFSGQDNLIFSVPSVLPLGVATTGVCAQLGPLRDNGGGTMTHALMSGSPAIDLGNTLWAGIGAFDQRGSPFARVSGNQADIGAHEVQQADIIFTAGFDGCP